MKFSEIRLKDENLKDGTLAGYPCVWVSFLGRDKPSPLEAPFLAWLDWELQGVLSRYLLGEGWNANTTTFVPTMHKLPFPYLALEPNRAPDWESAVRNCEGQGWKQVLLVTESKSAADKIKASCPPTLLKGDSSLEWHLFPQANNSL